MTLPLPLTSFGLLCWSSLPPVLLIVPTRRRSSLRQDIRKLLRTGRKTKAVLREVQQEKAQTGTPTVSGTEQSDGYAVHNFSPPQIDERHYKEMLASCIDEDIINLNILSLEGQEPYNRLLYSDKLPRTNTGRLSFSLLNRYQHLDAGGWWCGTVDVLKGGESLWGTFKPDQPRFDESKNKFIKYHHPEKEPTEIFALRIPVATFQLIARRYDVALPENYRSVVEYPNIFWKWVIQHPSIPLVLTEGAKKGACILSRGYVAIASPGIYNFYRQPKNELGEPDGDAHLIEQLQVFVATGRRVYLAFDQDEKSGTVRAVNQALTKLSWILTKQKCSVHLISWNGRDDGKGIDDVLFRHQAECQEYFDNLYRQACSFEDWQSRQLRKLTYKADLLINQRYLGEVLPPSDAQFIPARCPKNTGKTQWAGWLVAPALKSGERRVLLLTHRVQLSTQTANRIGIPYITEIKSAEQGTLFGYGLVIDSLHPLSQARFRPSEWAGAIVIIDEVMQLIWHLLSSSTCHTERVQIIKTLQELLRTVVSTGGKILALDADLSDVAIDFVEGLIGFSPKRFLIVNEFKFTEPWTVHRFKEKNPSRLIGELERRLISGEKALLCVSGQKAKSKWGTKVLEEFFKRRLPYLRILRIDSESVANPQHPAFGCTDKLNEVVTDYDLVIASPTIETGVSLEVKHFDGVWYVGQGVQTTDGARQHLSRVRSPIPRYVWIKSTGINRVGNGSTSQKGLIASQKKLDKANRAKLLDAGLEEMSDGNFAPICLQSWAKLGAVINLGMNAYEETILRDLEDEGHIIRDWQDDEDKEDDEEDEPIDPEAIKNSVTEVKNEVYQQYRDGVAAAEKLSDKELEALRKQQSRNDAQLLQLRKGEIENRYLIDCTPDLVLKDDEKWFGKVRLHYFWEPGRDYLPFRDRQSFEKSVTQGQGDYFVVDTNKSLNGLEVALLDHLGISRLYNTVGLHNDHPIIIDIFEKIKKHAFDVKLITGLTLTKLVQDETKRIACVQAILSLIDHKMACYARTGGRGDQVRYYSSPAPSFKKDEETDKLVLDNGLPIPILDGREAVFEAWLLRDGEAKRKADEDKAAAQAEETLRQDTEKRLEEVRLQWLGEENLRSLANDLEACDETEALLQLRQCYPDFAIEASRPFMELQKWLQIKQWMVEQDERAKLQHT